jgi:hypothetical protein
MKFLVDNKGFHYRENINNQRPEPATTPFNFPNSDTESSPSNMDEYIVNYIYPSPGVYLLTAKCEEMLFSTDQELISYGCR